MRQLLTFYGKFLLDAAVVALLVTLVFFSVRDGAGNRGVLSIVGANLDTGGRDYTSYGDYSVYDAESRKPAPQITCTFPGGLVVGNIPLTAYVHAVDADGSVLPVKVEEILDADGTDCMGAFSGTTGTFYAPKAGYYLFRLSARDAAGRQSIWTVKLPVNP